MSDLISFLNECFTSYHAVEQMIKLSKAIEFKKEVKPDTIYFVKNEGSLVLFKTPKGQFNKARIAAAHTDSPALKLKPNPEVVENNLLLLASDVYGGPLLNSWLNRDLMIAGRIFYADKAGKILEELVSLKDFVVSIPQLAPHLDRTVNEDGLKLNPQMHLRAVAGFYDKKLEGKFLETLLKKKVLTHDLFLVSREEAVRSGYKEAFISGPRLDNLASCHAVLTSFLENKSDDLMVAVFWDHEEIGSSTSSGAESPFFSDSLERFCLSAGMDRREFLEFKSNSLTVSCDLAHADNPNYPGKMEPNHTPRLGEGPVVKWSASQRYATSAKTAAEWVQAGKGDIQHFVVRGDLKGGSTIGPIHASKTGITTLDVGIAQLSMHSLRELIAEKDHLSMIRLLGQFYRSL